MKSISLLKNSEQFNYNMRVILSFFLYFIFSYFILFYAYIDTYNYSPMTLFLTAVCTKRKEDIMKPNITLRFATPNDAEEIRSIYAPYVTDTAVTSEYEIPTIEEFQNRIYNTLKKYPYLIALKDNELIGYMYTSPVNIRAAYNWAAETSIYIRQHCRRTGAGSKLYKALFHISKKQHIVNLYARIAYADPEDEYLVNHSARFHHTIGFEQVARFHKVFHKFGRWYDALWVEKILGDHSEGVMSDVIPFPELHIAEEEINSL